MGRDNSTRAAKVIVGATGGVIERPVNLLYPLEESILKTEPKIENRKSKIEVAPERAKRKAAVMGEIRRRCNK